MPIHRLSSIGAAAALLLAPIAAQAQTCATLRAELNANNMAMAGIAIDYPRTHLAIVLCLATNERRDDVFACAATAIGLACLGMGSDYCYDLTSRWARAGQNYWSIAARMRYEGCRF
jgi:hypothetical protein